MQSVLTLKPHPLTPCSVASRIDVALALHGRSLELTYQITTPQSGLAVPNYEEPVRADDLWKETCCEAFLQAAGQDSYVEINLSPSTQWAVYGFTNYREGMRPRDIGAAPVIDREVGAEGLTLTARVDLSLLPTAFAQADWCLGLSAVICGTSGERSFWALNHPPEKPDFHHRDCFAFQINAADRT
ncbi:MAG: DOMON-like domain-containing protein [Chakrabartia sp.]